MKTFSTIDSYREYLISQNKPGAKIGFVPTMGALHAGHLSLVEQAMSDNDSVAVSIFVNPVQFNNPEDLKKYPRTIEKDLAMLDQILKPDDIVFVPSAEEMYPEQVTTVYDFGPLAAVMEGEKRPGHFNGVGIVVNKLLRIIEPDTAYFGEKDFQQLAIIRKLVDIESLPVKIIACPIIREADGLAMSSRNARLNQEDRTNASEIYHSLKWTREQFLSGEKLKDISGRVIKKLNSIPNFEVEYLSFATESTLTPITKNPVNQTPITQTPINQTPINQNPVNQTPINQTPITQTPITQTPVIQTPINQTPVIQTPVNQTPITQTPINQTPVNQTPVNQTPVIRCFIAVFVGDIRLIDNLPMF